MQTDSKKSLESLWNDVSVTESRIWHNTHGTKVNAICSNTWLCVARGLEQCLRAPGDSPCIGESLVGAGSVHSSLCQLFLASLFSASSVADTLSIGEKKGVSVM